ncbi:MAG: hypothetical protein AMXMBFR34_33900 [Myxococcaceae bacterium]
MARKRSQTQLAAAARVRHVLAMDAANVMKRLHARQDEMVRLFSRLRDRAPLMNTVHTWFTTITLAELTLLEPPEQHAVNAFYEALDDLRWYLQYTEEMPTHVREKLSRFVRRLDERHHALTAAIGPADQHGGPVVDVKVVRAGR